MYIQQFSFCSILASNLTQVSGNLILPLYFELVTSLFKILAWTLLWHLKHMKFFLRNLPWNKFENHPEFFLGSFKETQFYKIWKLFDLLFNILSMTPNLLLCFSPRILKFYFRFAGSYNGESKITEHSTPNVTMFSLTFWIQPQNDKATTFP
jgi:hypothetical protein